VIRFLLKNDTVTELVVYNVTTDSRKMVTRKRSKNHSKAYKKTAHQRNITVHVFGAYVKARLFQFIFRKKDVFLVST